MSLKHLLGKILVYGVLEIGALCGVPMSPEKIEALMNIHNRTVIVVRNTNEDGDDEPR